MDDVRSYKKWREARTKHRRDLKSWKKKHRIDSITKRSQDLRNSRSSSCTKSKSFTIILFRLPHKLAPLLRWGCVSFQRHRVLAMSTHKFQLRRWPYGVLACSSQLACNLFFWDHTWNISGQQLLPMSDTVLICYGPSVCNSNSKALGLQAVESIHVCISFRCLHSIGLELLVLRWSGLLSVYVGVLSHYI